MFATIKFTTGSRENLTYVYKNEHQFTPTYWAAKVEPLSLTDFESIEVLSRPILDLGNTDIKCTLADGSQSMASVTPHMLGVLEKYIFAKAQTNGTPAAPRTTYWNYFSFRLVFVILLFGFLEFLRRL